MRRVTPAAGALALAALALVAAGCGGGSPSSGIANIGTTAAASTTNGSGSQSLTPQSKVDAAFAFSKCMRANGVPNFPDPQTNGHGMSLAVGPGTGIDPNTPQFKKAQTTCQKLLPNGGKPSQQQIQKVEHQALAYAACMRSHGVPSFPDPQFSTGGGGFGIRIGGKGSGIDPSSPAFQKAQQACSKTLPGLIQRKGPGPGSRPSTGSSESGATQAPSGAGNTATTP